MPSLSAHFISWLWHRFSLLFPFASTLSFSLLLLNPSNVFADHLSHIRCLLSPILPTFSEHVCAGSCRCHLKTSFSLVSGYLTRGNEMNREPRPSPPLPDQVRGVFGHLGRSLGGCRVSRCPCVSLGVQGHGPEVAKGSGTYVWWQQRIPVSVTSLFKCDQGPVTMTVN